jgi:hypothetical protein
VDIKKTLFRYIEITRKNSNALSREVEWCRDKKIDCIVSDITPFAFEVASAARVPSIAVTNFSWYDIYREYVSTYSLFMTYLEKMCDQYKSAHLLLRLYPSLPMGYFPVHKDIAPVGRKGVNRREELERLYPIIENKKIALIYIGKFGLPQIDWPSLEKLSEWEFFGIDQLPGAPGNYHQFNPETFHYPDLIASVDCAVGKLGYGMVAECLINGTPLLFLPRNNFAEYPVLEKEVLYNGYGIKISPDTFFSLDWEPSMKQLSEIRLSGNNFDNGALACAETIENVVNSRR